MAEGVGKVTEIFSRVRIPDGPGMETEGAAAKKAEGKPGEKPTPKKAARATCVEGWTLAAREALGEGCIGVHSPGSPFAAEALKPVAVGWAR